MNKDWKKQHAGRYVHKSGWAVERSDRGGWNVINPKSGRVHDSFKKKSDAMKIYRDADLNETDDHLPKYAPGQAYHKTNVAHGKKTPVHVITLRGPGGEKGPVKQQKWVHHKHKEKAIAAMHDKKEKGDSVWSFKYHHDTPGYDDAKKKIEESAPTNSMGMSSSSAGPVMTIDPLLRKRNRRKVLRRFNVFLAQKK